MMSPPPKGTGSAWARPIGNLRERLEAEVGLRIFDFPMPFKIAGVFAYTKISARVSGSTRTIHAIGANGRWRMNSRIS